MEITDSKKTLGLKSRFVDLKSGAASFAKRWLYLISLILILIYSIFVWYTSIYNSEWSEEKKQNYIREQAVFKFDKSSYKKIVEIFKVRQESMQSGLESQARDIFYPED